MSPFRNKGSGTSLIRRGKLLFRIEEEDLAALGRASRRHGGKISLYSDGGGALLDDFFPGEMERGGVVEEDARRSCLVNGDHEMTLLYTSLRWDPVMSMYEMMLSRRPRVVAAKKRPDSDMAASCVRKRIEELRGYTRITGEQEMS